MEWAQHRMWPHDDGGAGHARALVAGLFCVVGGDSTLPPSIQNGRVDKHIP